MIRSSNQTFVLAASLLAMQLGAGCSRGGFVGNLDGSVHDARSPHHDAAILDLTTPSDFSSAGDLRATSDLAGPNDFALPPDFAAPADMAMPRDMASGGPITGGPCSSGSSGATALRIRWYDSGGRATVSYEVEGLPDKSADKVGVYSSTGSTGFMPQFVDPSLGDGGLQLDGSDFIDINMSTVGVSRINSVSLSIRGRSYSTGSSGSFNWQTFVDVGATPTNFVSNVAPYRWYTGDATTAIDPSNSGILLRVRAGGSSGSLVVNRLELCIDAN